MSDKGLYGGGGGSAASSASFSSKGGHGQRGAVRIIYPTPQGQSDTTTIIDRGLPVTTSPLSGTISFSTTASTSSQSETHTADAIWSSSGSVIIHDGWNQQDTDAHAVAGLANHGTFTVANSNITVDVEVWGAAGGSGQGSYAGLGGGGEYRKARMVLKPGTYYWMVGAGGGCGTNAGNRQGSGGWGGGGSGGDLGTTTQGPDGTAFSTGGDISTQNNTRNALGSGGGGLTGIFGATSPSQSDALLVAGAGGGYGYNAGPGLPGGDTSSRSGSDTAGGTNNAGGRAGGAGFGGGSEGRGGGGGGGYWGGSGGNDNSGASGGGGRGYTVASNGHSLVGTVSDTTTTAGTNGTPGGTGSSNYITNLAASTATQSRAGRGGRLVITIV